MYIVSIVARVLLALMVVASVLPLFPVGAWTVRLFDFPRLQVVGITLLALLALWGAYTALPSATAVATWTVLGLAVLGWQLSHVAWYTPFWPREVPNATDSSDPSITVAVINLQFDNPEKQPTLEALRGLDAQLLLLMEYDEAWAKGLAPLADDYPYREDVVRDKGLGIALWSKFPLHDTEVRHLVSEDRASIFADFEYAEGRRAHFIGLHPTPPGLEQRHADGRHDSRIRDAELMLVAKHIAEHKADDWIVTGDFNDVAWSHTTRLFQRMSGLKDPRVGRGLYNTYHANHPLFRFPIDHVFLPASARIVRLERLDTPGSDHFGFLAEFTLEGSEPTRPQPEGDDRKQAEEMVKEGKNDAAEANER
jgi:endonuclease/exonuclease/phosphatase (EEP) superfamily protein YafD